MLNILLCLLLGLSALAHESLESTNHQDVYNKAQELKSKYLAKEILIVFDIDNTLLKAKQPLGSDQWFEWQAEALSTSSTYSLFKNFDALLNAQADFFQMSSMSLTQEDIPEIVQNLKRQGHKIVLLTSRGPNLRNATERELSRNHLNFEDSTIMKGIASDIVEAPFKNKVSFMNGVFMTAGHHKGEALDYLIKKSRKKFKAIIFADDHKRHTTRVAATFAAAAEPEMITFRYGREDETVAAFKASPKESINEQALELMNAIDKVFQK